MVPPRRVTEWMRTRSSGYRERLRTSLAKFWVGTGSGRVAVCSVLVGCLAGLSAVVFASLLELLSTLVLEDGMGLRSPPTLESGPGTISLPNRWWLVLLIPTVGGLLAGGIVSALCPEARGDGTDSMSRAFHHGAGVIRGRVPLIKGLTSIVTICTGGSAGQEGPISQIGAGLGSTLARWFGFTPRETRLLMLAGAAGGLGAIFRAPLGGALFATEVLYMTTASETAALLPCLTSSIVAYSVFALFITPTPIFLVPPMAFHGFTDLPAFALLGLACTGLGWVYVRVFHGMRSRIFDPLPLPSALKPALGGFLVGMLGIAFPQVLSAGYGWVQWGAIGEPPGLALNAESVFVPNMGGWMLLVLALGKILATSLTISSGGSGGVFGPSIFIGGALGGAMGQLLSNLTPAWQANTAAFALVGMGGFFAGVSKAPIASILMVCELSGNYSLLVPMMLVCSIHLALSKSWTLYHEQVPSPIDSPAHLGEFVVDVLEQIKVGSIAMKGQSLETFAESTPFAEVLKRVVNSFETIFPVLDRQGRLTGIFTLHDIRLALLGSEWSHLVVAADLASSPVQSVTPADDLNTALQRLTELNVDAIPVVDQEDPSKLIGLLSHRELVAVYMSQLRYLRSRS